MAYVPKVDVRRSLSALMLVLHRRAGRINEQVHLGNSRPDLHRGLNWKGCNQHEGPATASWNGY